jgi:hypothetical protein
MCLLLKAAGILTTWAAGRQRRQPQAYDFKKGWYIMFQTRAGGTPAEFGRREIRMRQSFDEPEEAGPQRDREIPDSRYHDEDEIVPVDDIQVPRIRAQARRKPARRPPPRRHYYEG